MTMMNAKEQERTNVTCTCNKEANKHKETLITYGNKGEKNTSRTSENKEKAHDGYVHMYECGKPLSHSIYERECTETYIYISNIEEIVAKYKFDYQEIKDCLVSAK